MKIWTLCAGAQPSVEGKSRVKEYVRQRDGQSADSRRLPLGQIFLVCLRANPKHAPTRPGTRRGTMCTRDASGHTASTPVP